MMQNNFRHFFSILNGSMLVPGIHAFSPHNTRHCWSQALEKYRTSMYLGSPAEQRVRIPRARPNSSLYILATNQHEVAARELGQAESAEAVAHEMAACQYFPVLPIPQFYHEKVENACTRGIHIDRDGQSAVKYANDI